jgi:hypothetical protein
MLRRFREVLDVAILDPQILSDYNGVRQTKNKEIFCHAPFTSINFEQNGNASVCCYSRRHVLVPTPGDSIDDIWFGKKADQLRSMMRRNTLPGMRHLPGSVQQSKLRRHPSALLRPPREFELSRIRRAIRALPQSDGFETSNICNLRCVMCKGYFSSAIRKNREKLPPLNDPYDDNFIRQLEPTSALDGRAFSRW